ncbi:MULTISPECIES: DUF29 domain-containing protein [Thiorhodovibrio]|nr:MULTISPECIES: DUF29 domain-containing protein [Thiorhodovibrio]
MRKSPGLKSVLDAAIAEVYPNAVDLASDPTRDTTRELTPELTR